MLALALAIAATTLLTPTARAQDQTDQQKNYTVWSSVVLTRTGNRTPDSLRDIPTKLTSFGANQAFAAGTFFRDRYIVLDNGTNGIGGSGAPLRGIDPNIYSNSKVYASALDQQWNSATATAFFQGFYPSTGGLNSTTTPDLTSSLSNGTYITGPLDGYQYPRISAPTIGSDPMTIYLNAASLCESFGTAEYQSLYTQQANNTRSQSESLYREIGNRFLSEVLPSGQFWSYENAYPIYDYVRYKYEHNEAAQRQLDEIVEGTSTSYITALKELADQQLYGIYGNMSAINPVTENAGLSGGTRGSISTISGNYLAANIYSRLADAVYGIDGYQPLNLLFADYQPFMSLFALTDLPEQSSNFYGLPNFGASLVFELFSLANSSVASVPEPSELFVRFLFRNGTEPEDELQAYSIFNRPKEQFDIPWSDFVSLMNSIRVEGTQTWCSVCGNDYSGLPFCAANRYSSARQPSGPMSPVVAGVIGAFVTLAIAALVFGAVMLLCGVRLHRNGSSRRKSDLGGFKGGQKMASDQDLTIPKGGAVVGAAIERHGHERTGSWELKQTEAGQGDGEWRSARPSMEQIRAVEPHERV